MNQSSARVLIRTICYLLILFATIVAILLVYLSQLDLNDYRLSLGRQLSTALGQPVQIGHSSLTFDRGLALALEDLQIGPDHAILADIPKITATLKISPLFKGQFILDQIQVNDPKFQLWLPFSKRSANGTPQQLLNSLGISLLSIHNASITIYQKQDKGAVQRFVLSDLNAILRGWKPEKTGQLVVSGELQEQGGNFLFETQLPSSSDPDVWRNEEHRTQLAISNFSTDKILNLYSQNLPKSLNLILNIQGAPAAGTIFTTTLTDSNSDEHFFSLSGRWKSSNQQESITGLKGELLKIPLSGDFYLLRQAKKHYLAGRFGAENVTLNSEILKAWKIPNADKLIHGDLERLTIALNKSWDSTHIPSELPDIGVGITVCDLDWKLPTLKQFQDLSIEFSLKKGALSVNDGILVGGDQSIDFSGEIRSLFQQPHINMKFEFNPHINDFLEQSNLPETWSISGNTPGFLNLTGSLLNPDFLLKANLSSTSFQLGNLFNKQPTDQASLQLRGQLSSNRLQLEQFSLELNDVNISGSGYLQQNQGEQEYRFSLQSIDLNKLKPFSPLLHNLQIKGEIEPTVTQQKTGLQGTLKLKNIGAHLTSVIGDLNKATGTVNLDRHGFTFQNFQASLGKSNFIVDGVFNDWGRPQLNLDLNGKKIRAQDLIFSNQQLTLYDLNGHLLINADGINFSPVNVRLEENTLATVNGTVRNFSDPLVSLDIQSDQVDVLDIIDLFVGPKTAETKKQNSRDRPPLLIKVSAKQGTLGGLHFQNAKGLIRGDNHRLTIFPLKFNNGEGWCKTRIEFNYGDDTAPLRISGHAEKIDASILHQKLFKRQGLVSGSLGGDFYIEGNPGEGHFWQAAKGGIHGQISDGTLRKFHGLAKMFSLLNVSQIFAGKLPDMDKEGMPFSLLEANVQIDAGQATTKDLKITSESMNLSAIGTQNLVDDTLDFTLGVMPLRTVDKIITSIPIAGWVLAGEEKALITAHFKIEGTSESPNVTAIPIDSVSKTVFGIFKRTLGLPGKLVKDIGTLFKNESVKKVDE